MYIAHRGKVYGKIKENTLKAFKESIKDDYYSGFELDIRMSKDKIIVVNHNFFIKNKLISNTNYNELKKMGIIKLEDVLKLSTNKIILIEIKDPYINLEILNKLLNKYKEKNIYLMSFFNDIIKKYIKMEHFCSCGILHYVFNREYSYSEYDFICLLDRLITNNLLNYFKSKNIKVFSYGIINKIKFLKEDVYYIVDYK